MRQDMAADGLAAICTGEESTGARIGLDLVRLKKSRLAPYLL